MIQTQVIYVVSQRKDPSSHWRKQQRTRRGLWCVVEPLSMKLNWFASFFSGAFVGRGSSTSSASAVSASSAASAVCASSSSPAACKKIQQWLHPERTSHLFSSSQTAGFLLPSEGDCNWRFKIRRLPAHRSRRIWNNIWMGIQAFRNWNCFKTKPDMREILWHNCLW